MKVARNLRLFVLSSVMLILAAYFIYGIAFLTPEPFVANSLGLN